ncbi:MAG: hypothetical protein Q8Q03_00510 [bacterium]|nr:hypothetical protein [bacterium]
MVEIGAIVNDAPFSTTINDPSSTGTIGSGGSVVTRDSTGAGIV